MTHKKSKNEEKLAEYVRNLDEESDVPRPAASELSESEVLQLKKAEAALDFLRQVRKDRGDSDVSDVSADTAEFSSAITTVIEKSTAAQVGEVFGRFEIEDILGQGGFSRVFLARDPKLNRLVALKVPLPGALVSDSFKLRFEREARTAAILSHPSIVPTFESGNVGPISYIAMGYIRGETLDQWFASHGKVVPHRVTASIVAELANAIEHAHQRGIVHRDIKPANILVEAQDMPVNQSASVATELAGRLRITDFGLAKLRFGDEEKITMDGSVIGTPAYMSPEQARGEDVVSPSNDIFSLGTVLYELLTGELPFKGESHLATIAAIQEKEPKPPGSLREGLPKDLAAICLKCLKKDVTERYQSAFELEADLRRWLSGMPIKARNATSFENLAGWRRRNPRLSTAIAAAVLATICGLAGTTWQWQNAEKNAKAAKLAVIEQKRATAAEELAKQNALDALDDSAVFLQFLSEQVLGAARPVGLGRGQGKDVTILEALKSADPGSYKAFEARPVAEAQAREALGTTWRMLGRFDLAAQQVAEALRLKLENLGELDHRTILSQVEHANILAANGRLEEAGASYQILLERCLDELGDDHRLTIGCKNNLASVLMKTSRFREALPLFEEVWEQITEKEGPNHTGSLQVTRNYAACLRRNHRLRRCRELIEEQIKYVRAELGENDYRTISAIGELGETLIVEGKPKLAEPLLKEALQLASTHLGPTHPKTIDIMFFSMENLLALGHVDEARELARDAIELCRETFGPAHHQTLNGERWQINELYRYGHDQAALDLIEEFLPRCSAIDTPAARRMELTLITDRIRTLGRVGRYRESNELMKRSLDRLTAGLGEDHIMLLGCFQQVGDNYLALKDFERSRRAFAHLQKQIERGELDQPRAQLTAGFAALGLARSLHFLNDFPMAISNAQSAIGYFHGSVESPIWEVAARGQLAASRLQRGQSKSDEDLETLESTHRELQNHADVDNPNLNHRMVLKESRDLLLDYYTQINDAQRVAELEAEAERFSE